jgi:hypothetical protein
MNPASGNSPEAQAIKARILQAIIARGGASPVCPVCSQRLWTVGPYIPMGVSTNPQQVRLGPEVVPCVILSCDTCGDMLLINLLILGFSAEELPTLAY